MNGSSECVTHSTSSLRKQGPITTGVCVSRSRQPLYHPRGRGVWVPGSRGTTANSRIDVHEVAQQGIDLVVPAAAGEHAVMADAGLHVMDLAIGAYAGAEVLRGERLADRADIVLFAFDRHQPHPLDRGRVHRPAAIG